MIIGICGLGIVGNAILHFFKDKENIKVVIYDKFKKEYNNFEDLLKTDIIFMYLTTLYSDSLKDYNTVAIHENCIKLNNNNYNGTIVLKSTVSPGTTENLTNLYKNLKIIHNPEFLSAKTNIKDFCNQTHIVIGIPEKFNKNHFDNVINLYKKYFPKSTISISTSNESEIMKLAVNNFYAVKIQFFNEIYLLANKCNSNYEIIKDMMLKNDWINPMHTNVPGHDGKLSYGGACFPKDTNALNEYLKKNNLPNSIINAAVLEQKELRDKELTDIL